MIPCHYCGALFEQEVKTCSRCLTPRPVLFAQLTELSAGEVQFGAGIRIAVLALLKGEIGGFAFTDAMYRAVRVGMRDAWLEGAKIAGFAPDEIEPADERALLDIQHAMLQRVLSLQADVLKRRDRLLFAPEEFDKHKAELWNRITIWDARYEQARSEAIVRFSADQKLEWIMDPRKDHCISCMKLDGKVKRASWWRDNGILPQVPGAWYLI